MSAIPKIKPKVATNNTNSTIIWSWESKPFGESKPNEDVDNDGNKFTLNLRFPGQYYDKESGKHYNINRDYDPITGRYIQSDPIGFEGGSNTYLYANGNSLRFVDESGLNPADYILSMQPNNIYDDLEVRAVQKAGSYQEIIDTRNEIQSAFENGAQIVLLATGAGEVIAISRVSWYTYTKLGYKMFNSETIGIASELLGNTLVRGGKTSLLNNKKSFIRIGWSNIYKDNIGGGFVLRIGIGAKKYHLDLPGTFIPNEIANPIVVFLQNFKL